MVVPVPKTGSDEQLHMDRKPLYPTLSDRMLLERSMDNDRAAFNELVRRYFSVIYATSFAIIGSQEEAEDACQESLIKAFRYIRTLRDPNKFGFWLRSIVRQESYSRLKKQSKILRLLKTIHGAHQSDVVQGRSEKQRRLYHQQLLNHALHSLTEKAREIVLLHYISGLSCEEIALQTGSQPGTIKSHLFKARQKMLHHLSKVGVHSTEDL